MQEKTSNKADKNDTDEDEFIINQPLTFSKLTDKFTQKITLQDNL